MRKTWLIFSQAVTVALAVLFVVSTLKPEWVQRRPFSAVASNANAPSFSTPVLPVSLPPGATSGSYAPAAKRAAPAVVSVVTSKKLPTGHPR